MEKLTAKDFVNNKLGDKNCTHSPYPMYRDEMAEWLIEYAALINLSLGNVSGCTPSDKFGIPTVKLIISDNPCDFCKYDKQKRIKTDLDREICTHCAKNLKDNEYYR